MQWELPRPKASQCATGAQDKLEGCVNNSVLLRTEKAVSKKEVYTEGRVVVCHGLGDVALKCLTLGLLGERGALELSLVWSSRSCRVVNAF
jgi:hypothetical protein